MDAGLPIAHDQNRGEASSGHAHPDVRAGASSMAPPTHSPEGLPPRFADVIRNPVGAQ
jgi:hypothetical protein